MIDSDKLISLLDGCEYLGKSRIDGYPIYKYRLGPNPRTKGLDSFMFKYNKLDSDNPIQVINELESIVHIRWMELWRDSSVG